MARLRILLYGDVNLNIIDGSSVWLTALANCLSQDDQVDVTILLKDKMRERELLNSVCRRVNYVEGYACRKVALRKFLTPHKAVKVIEKLDTLNNYDCIIVRGDKIAQKIIQSKVGKKVIPYITNFTHDKDKITQQEIDQLRAVYDAVSYMFVQTLEMQKYLQAILSVQGDKFVELSPMIPNPVESQPPFENKHNQLVYAGKFARNWNILEIIKVLKKLEQETFPVRACIVGSKFQRDVSFEKEQIIQDFEHSEIIHWYNGLSRDQTMEIVKDSDIGIGWRSSEIDNDSSLELSTKILEYGILGKPYIVRRTKIHEQLLGADYELFVDDEDDVICTLKKVFQDPSLYAKAAETVYRASSRYTYQACYARLKPVLWSYIHI